MAQEEDYSSDSDLSSEGTPPPPPQIPQRIQNWWLNECLGSGYSGSIYKAQNVHTHQIVALKIQYVNHECPTNKYERHFYPLLQGGVGMPRLFAAGVQGDWDFLAIDLLGSSLDSLFRKSGKEMMDLRSVCSIAVQVIQRLQFMHTRGVLHRDIQLGNCTIGQSPHEKTIYMIDFGFSKRFIDQYTGRHIADSKIKRDFIGNYWFSSVNVHCRGKVPSRRDDLEALALMLIHLLTPRGLSWTRNGVPKTTEAHDRLKAEKRNATPESLCRGLPLEFENFLSYTRRLAFKDCPDYGHWVEKFRDLGKELGYGSVDEFIWPAPVHVAPVQKNSNTPLRERTPGVPRDEMAGILNDLTRLNLGSQPVLGDRTNVQEAIRKVLREDSYDKRQNHAAQPQLQPVVGAGNGLQPAVGAPGNPLIISTDSEGDHPAPMRFQAPKAFRLNQLADKASTAADNKSLAGLIKEFVQILQMNSSRTLTKEASYFLDVLYKQLDDPSVFVKPQKPSRQQSFNEPVPEKQPAHVKLGVVARLRREVTYCPSNKALGVMVSDFAKVTNKSTGRTVTKDGFAFLDGLADRLTALNS